LKNDAQFILNDFTREELAKKLPSLGIDPSKVGRIISRVHRSARTDDISAWAREKIGSRALFALKDAGAVCGRIAIVTRRHCAADNFQKYVMRLSDGMCIEAVRIPLPAGPMARPDHYVACVSSQVGCALGCSFCATGRAGFSRNLAAWEIVEQVAAIRADSPEAPVSGIVFMGMGEPFLNYDAVLRAADILSEPAGLAIAKKSMTISTAGIVPGIRRFTDEGRKIRLAVSLTSAIEEKRVSLMPVGLRYPLAELVDAARAYCQKSRERVVFEYVMISGLNVGREDAQALIELLRGLRLRLNLIEVNDATGRFIPPGNDEYTRFRKWLNPLDAPIVRRYSGGREINAACGMLAADIS